MRQHLARGTRKKKIRIYRSSPRARSSNTKLKFYCNAKRIAYFKMNPCIFILCTMKNIYILTQALEAFYALEVLYVLVYIASFHVLQVLHVLMYIDSLYAFQVLHVLVYIDSLHVFVYISLPLLRHSMYSRRLLKATLYHVFMQFGRRSIATPINSAQPIYSFSTPVYYLYTRVVLCLHLKICFTPISLSSSFLLQLDLYVYARLPRAPLHRSM